MDPVSAIMFWFCGIACVATIASLIKDLRAGKVITWNG